MLMASLLRQTYFPNFQFWGEDSLSLPCTLVAQVTGRREKSQSGAFAKEWRVNESIVKLSEAVSMLEEKE
jgi:hypothetical protein